MYVCMYKIMILPELPLVQDCTLTLGPEQPFPLHEGTGLLHFLLHCFVPLPHAALHEAKHECLL